jgi:hypothetical protein
MMHKTSIPYLDTGDMTTFEQTMCHSYVACNVTNGYSSPGHVMNGNTPKLDEVSRQFVYVAPDVLVVFDRVEALDPTYEKRFLLQTPDNPVVAGSSYTLTNGAGKLYAQTMLPTGATANVLTNFTVAGTPHPPTVTGNESFGTRIEVVAPTGQTRDYFLHVIGTGATAPTATVMQDSTSATVSITAPQGKYTLTFDKMGALGGHLTSMDVNGNVTCDETLGTQAQMPDGGVSGDGGNPPPGGDGGTGPNPPGSGGCGCNTPGERTGDAFALVAMGAIALVTRRRRSR